MFSLSILSVALLSAPAILATSQRQPALSACDLSNAKVPVYPSMTAPTIPIDFVGVAIGVQNYTCNATSGTYINLGNVAELYDISCFASSPFLNDITNTTYAAWKLAPPSLTTQKVIQNAGFSLLPVLGQLYFIEPSPGAATIAKWDFTSSGATKGNPDAYTIDAADVIVLGNRPDIDIGNIQLHSIGGKLATLIYRLQMVGGRPPSSCSGSGSISVKFTGLYYFLGYHA